MKHSIVCSWTTRPGQVLWMQERKNACARHATCGQLDELMRFLNMQNLHWRRGVRGNMRVWSAKFHTCPRIHKVYPIKKCHHWDNHKHTAAAMGCWPALQIGQRKKNLSSPTNRYINNVAEILRRGWWSSD